MRRLLTVLVPTVLLVTACGGDDDDPAQEVVAETTTTSTTAAEDCVADSGDGASLEVVVPESAPAGFEVGSEKGYDTGPSDLAKAVRDDGGPDAEEQLTAERFTAGYQRIWVDDDDAQLIAFIYEFCDAAGAEAHTDRSSDGAIEGGFSPFPVPDPSGGLGWYGTKDGYTVATVMVPHGRYHLLAVSGSDTVVADESTHRTRAADLAKQLVAGADARDAA